MFGSLLPIAGSVLGGIAGNALGIGSALGAGLGALSGSLLGGNDLESSIVHGLGAGAGAYLLGDSSMFEDWGTVGDLGIGSAAAGTRWSDLAGAGIGSLLTLGLSSDLGITPPKTASSMNTVGGPVDTTRWWGPRILEDNPYVSLDYGYPTGPQSETSFFRYV